MINKDKNIKHFLDLDQIGRQDLRLMLDLAEQWRKPDINQANLPLQGKFLACIFEKPSTRTRVSFDVGMKQLGGDVVMMTPSETQLGRNETEEDTAKVLSGYVDAIMIRTDREEKMLKLAHAASIPVINGLTDRTHPCQLMADILTIERHFKRPVQGMKIAWIGDGNNMATSWIHAAVQFDFSLHIACPNSLRPPQAVLDWAKSKGNPVMVCDDAKVAVMDADVVSTDVWVSMSDEGSDEGDDKAQTENQRRKQLLLPFQVNQDMMQVAKKEAIFLHCLPAHRGEEVSSEVIDGAQSQVWQQAENRLHAQKGILLWCFNCY